jgi:hypothetical protein
MLGQTKFEFIFTVVIFAIVIFFAVSQVNILFTAIITDSTTDIAKTISTPVINLLVKDEGEPPNWESDPSNAKWVGLATDHFILSKQKVEELHNNCTLLNVYNLGEYNLVIYNKTHRILFCGYESLEIPKSIIIKYVFVDNDVGNVTLKVW